jgi:TatD DNase family protein
MTWVDTHCHLQLDERPAEALIDRAREVDWMVVPGIDLESSLAAQRLAAAYPGRLEWSAGLHPHDASRWPEEAQGITSLAESAAAIGETGLDYYRELSSRDDQRRSFRDQLELGTRLRKPVIVHCRDAFSDVHELIEQTGAGDLAVLHCWTGGRKWTRRFLELGVVFSFAGPLAFDSGETIRLAAELVSGERAMVETDTPYLAPPPHRGEPNEPAFVAYNGAVLASVWGVEVAEAARLTSATADRVFRSGQ